jgi:hypothetical protein
MKWGIHEFLKTFHLAFDPPFSNQDKFYGEKVSICQL